MLKAFDSIEAAQMDTGIVDTHTLNTERSMALDFVRANPARGGATSCPVCGKSHLRNFMTLESTPYLRCEHCASIFISVHPDIIEQYKNYEPINNFRSTEEYQAIASEKRMSVWNDLVFWVRFRCARYLQKYNGLDVVLYGGHYQGLSNNLENSGLCGSYRLEASVLSTAPESASSPGADVLLYLDQLAREAAPLQALSKLHGKLKTGGLLILSTRVGSGIDILTMKEKIKNVFPYEHTLLASVNGLEILVNHAGFELLEIQTPGALDVKYLRDNVAAMGEDNLYLRYLLETADNATLAEFQNFLQKSGTSSHARIIARKK